MKKFGRIFVKICLLTAILNIQTLSFFCYAEKIVNRSGLVEAEKFLSAKIEQYKMDNLMVTMNVSNQQWMGNQLVKGFCGSSLEQGQEVYLVSPCVNKSIPLPYKFSQAVVNKIEQGTQKEWDQAYNSEVISTYEEAMVWILGHECWHFLCAVGEREGNTEANANKNGFKWLEEFREEKELSKI